jgi:hypothetical protein
MKPENNAENPKREKSFVTSFKKSVSLNNGPLPGTNLKKG